MGARGRRGRDRGHHPLPAPTPAGVWHRARTRLLTAVGGRARLQVAGLLAAVLAVDSADKGTLGAVAPQLLTDLHIDNTDLGLLATVSSVVGAVATMPFGVLVDKVSRVPLVVWSIVLWSAASAVSAFSTSFVMLLVTRTALGAVSGVAAPAVASLVGDYIPAHDRSRVYGVILSGELVGTGVGYVISGNLAAVLSWRAAFIAFALPGLALAYVLRRALPEPARGGQGQLAAGTVDLPAPNGAARPGPGGGGADRRADGQDGRTSGTPAEGSLVERQTAREHVEPAEDLVLREDPAGLSLHRAVVYVVRVRTNLFLIVASALGYFFFAGLQTFAVVFVRGRYGLGEAAVAGIIPAVGVGAVVGVVAGGRLGDGLVRRGVLTGRLVVGAVAYVAAALLFAPGIVSTGLLVALPLFTLAAGCLGAANPPVDAARLDIMPASLWGRAESVRTLLRQSLQAAAPLLFGWTADHLGGSTPGGTPGVGGFATGTTSAATAAALGDTFLVMLVPLAASGLLLLVARRTYPTDVATAAASNRAARAGRRERPQGRRRP